MDLAERIARRRTRQVEDRLVVNWDALNPAVHLQEPVGREALFEAILDKLDPLFECTVPPNMYIWGPRGSGKSAIVTALITTLKQELSRQRPLYTATRGESGLSGMRFVYLNSRQAASKFQIYRHLLNELRSGSVPQRGVSTDKLRERINVELSTTDGVLVAIDHVGEPRSVSLEDLTTYFDPFENAAWIGVGRRPPEAVPLPIPGAQVHVPEYSYELIDILTVRGTRGLSRNLDHVHAQEIAEWADGDAHDALTALYIACLNAEDDGQTRLRNEDIQAGMDAVPRQGESIGRILALSDNEQQVVRKLLNLPTDEERTIETDADLIAERTELTSATVKRLLYELAQAGILKRTEISTGRELVGRHPSRVSANFSAPLFEHLHEQ